MLPKPSWFTAMSTHIQVRMREPADGGMTVRVYPDLRWSASLPWRMIWAMPRQEAAGGLAVFAGIAPEIIRASAREARARGFGSFGVSLPGPVDGLGALAQAGAE